MNIIETVKYLLNLADKSTDKEQTVILTDAASIILDSSKNYESKAKGFMINILVKCSKFPPGNMVNKILSIFTDNEKLAFDIASYARNYPLKDILCEINGFSISFPQIRDDIGLGIVTIEEIKNKPNVIYKCCIGTYVAECLIND